MTGVAVTPVIGYLGRMEDVSVTPNVDEVGEWFTVPIRDLLDERQWTKREFSAPIFHGGPFPVSGGAGF